MLHERLRNVIVGPSFAKESAKVNRDYMGQITGREIRNIVTLPAVNTSESPTGREVEEMLKRLKIEFL